LPTKTLVSLIMPIHNEEDYLPESLKKIENQFFEFIFILDRCTDNAENIIMQWFPNTKIMKKESRKRKKSLFEASRGNIISTQDADATASHTLGHLLDKLQGDEAEVAKTLLTRKIVLFANHLYCWRQKTIGFAPACANFVNCPHLLSDSQDEDKVNDEFY